MRTSTGGKSQMIFSFLRSCCKMRIVFLFFVVFGQECINSEDYDSCEQNALNKFTKCNIDCLGSFVHQFFRFIKHTKTQVRVMSKFVNRIVSVSMIMLGLLFSLQFWVFIKLQKCVLLNVIYSKNYTGSVLLDCGIYSLSFRDQNSDPSVHT